MKTKFSVIILLLVFVQSYAQGRIVQIVTKNNDTIKNPVLKMSYRNDDDLVKKLQEKVVVLGKNGEKREYLPNEIKSFLLSYENDTKQFEILYESIDNTVFGQLMYSNKLKLLKIITIKCHYFIIVRPNKGKTSTMEAMGLSRLISLNTITREMGDCPSTLKKVEDNILKVHGEDGVLELVMDYEKNCLK